jgi:hypothetical protein
LPRRALREEADLAPAPDRKGFIRYKAGIVVNPEEMKILSLLDKSNEQQDWM